MPELLQDEADIRQSRMITGGGKLSPAEEVLASQAQRVRTRMQQVPRQQQRSCDQRPTSGRKANRHDDLL